MFKYNKLRRKLLRSGISREATEMYVYIGISTKDGKKGVEVFEKKSLVDKILFPIFSNVKWLKKHIKNFEKLYDNPQYRQEWVEKYQSQFGIN